MLFKLLCLLLCAVVYGEINNEGDGKTSCGQPQNSPVTHTPAGDIRGSWMKSRRGRQFEAYRGVRYAESPVGNLRFQPPRPIKRYKGTVDASEEGPACPQPTIEDYYVHEDCLRLNVYTPGKNSSKLPLPVVVFLHAGGFYSVSGRSDLAGPSYLLDRDIVLVTINYRLATLGFLSMGDRLAPGNNGFKDQVAALRWVRDNIASFGGDASRVTLAGYSAGSLSIGLHMVSPMSKGLFHRAISMSASPISQVVIGEHQRYLAVRQAKLFNCSTESNQKIFDCLKTKTSEELGDSLDSMFEFGYDPTLMWNVVIEPDFGQERFLTEQPLDLIRQGKMHAVPYIISQTQDEFFWKAFSVQNNATLLNAMNSDWNHIAPISFMLPPENSSRVAERLKDKYLHGEPVQNDTVSSDGLGKLYSDAVIGFAVHRMANLMCRHSPHPVYHCEFSYIGEQSHYIDPTTKKPVGAAHHDDLLYLFNVTAIFSAIGLDSPDSPMVDKMTAIWYNFARYGDPNPRGDTPELTSLCWPAMTSRDRKYLRIDKEFSVHQKLFEDRYNVWDDLYPIKY